MEALLPSEIARLVWGYLQAECPSAGHVFLKNCPALAECRDAKQKGRRVLDTVHGHSLLDLLADLSDTFNYVYEAQNCLSPEEQSDVKSKLSLCNKVDALFTHVKATSAFEAQREEVNAMGEGIADYREGSPVNTNPSIDDVMNTSPVRALMANLANKLKQNKTSIPFKKRRMTGSPSMNLEGTSDDSGMAPPADIVPILHPILKNTQFHERIAESINKIFQPKASCEDVNQDLEKVIHQVVKETEKDPTFEEIIQEICVGTQDFSAALSDVGSEDNGLGPALSPPLSLQLDSNGQDFAQANELHTPDPEEIEIQNTPTRGRKGRAKGASAEPQNEVPLKARLRSASKLGHCDGDASQDSLHILNEDAVRSIVEAIPDIDIATPPEGETAMDVSVDKKQDGNVENEKTSVEAPEITLEIPLSLEEQQSVSMFNQPMPISSDFSQPETQVQEPPAPPAPILPPTKIHPNPPLPSNPVGSIILIMEPQDSINTTPNNTRNIFTQRYPSIRPNGALPKIMPQAKPDRKLNQKVKVPKSGGKKLAAPDMPPPVITIEGLIVHPPVEQEFEQDYPNVSAPEVEEDPTPPTPDIIPPTPEHALPSASPFPQGQPLPQMAFVSMPSISPAQQGARSTDPPRDSPIAPVLAEGSTERPIEVRKSLSTPRRGSNYVRALDFSTPKQHKVAARRAHTSPKLAQHRSPSSTVKHLFTAARIVRSRLFEKSPETAKSKKLNKLSLISEEEPPSAPAEVETSVPENEIPPPPLVEESPTQPSPPIETPPSPHTPPLPKSPEIQPAKDSMSWDAKLRSLIGPVSNASSPKKSPVKNKRRRIGGEKASPKKRRSTPKKTPTKDRKSAQKAKEKNKRSKITPAKSATKRSRAALRTLNSSPTLSQTCAEKERLLESLQLSPSKPPPRIPEPTFELGNPRMKLVTCAWQGTSAGNFEPDLDRSYCMTISVEGEDGEEMDISLKWGQTHVWDSYQGETVTWAERRKQIESSEEELDRGPEDDDLMTFALIGSPSKSRSKVQSPQESSNPQDMLRKVGVDNFLSALHGKAKK
ncbi:uncharacterized protein LOC132195753 [Neocloeon triangulifer]|uniref:uncharacterized protein LOC132195753 n=1 Tax=Neocloeon triangulifer TaxID=2078957 RepID=UPI00286F4D67|nr:uncharacterized protein LOC132195753 [Neocloeon triangulifer]